MENLNFKNGSVVVVSNDANTIHVVQIHAGPLVHDAFRFDGALNLSAMLKAAEDRIKARLAMYSIPENRVEQAWRNYDASGDSFHWRLIAYHESPDFEVQWKGFGKLRAEICKHRKNII